MEYLHGNVHADQIDEQAGLIRDNYYNGQINDPQEFRFCEEIWGARLISGPGESSNQENDIAAGNSSNEEDNHPRVTYLVIGEVGSNEDLSGMLEIHIDPIIQEPDDQPNNVNAAQNDPNNVNAAPAQNDPNNVNAAAAQNEAQNHPNNVNAGAAQNDPNGVQNHHHQVEIAEIVDAEEDENDLNAAQNDPNGVQNGPHQPVIIAEVDDEEEENDLNAAAAQNDPNGVQNDPHQPGFVEVDGEEEGNGLNADPHQIVAEEE